MGNFLEEALEAVQSLFKDDEPDRSNLPVGIVIGGPHIEGAEHYRLVLAEPGYYLPIENGPPVPNALAYVPLSSMNGYNQGQRETYEALEAAGAFSDTPHPWGGANSPLIDYTHPKSGEIITAYVDKLLDAGYQGIFIDDHDVMFEAARLGQLNPQQDAAEKAFVRELVTHIKDREGIAMVNGILDIELMPFLGESGAEILTESQWALDGAPLGGELSLPDNWTLARMQAYVNAGGSHVNFVERYPLEGMDAPQTQAAIKPFLEQLERGFGEETAFTLYVAPSDEYSALQPQFEQSPPPAINQGRTR